MDRRALERPEIRLPIDRGRHAILSDAIGGFAVVYSRVTIFQKNVNKNVNI
jgi:hypothetical protein